MPNLSEYRKYVWPIVGVCVAEGNQLSGVTIPWLSEALFVSAGLLVAYFVGSHFWERRHPAVVVDGSNADPVPNMTIHDLFIHVDSRLVDAESLAAIEAVGRPVLDYFSTGQLKAWGREIDRTSGLGAALTPIPALYWKNRTFVYHFLHRDKGLKKINNCDPAFTHSWQETDGLKYTDLQVNQAEVYKIWPKRADVATAPANDDMAITFSNQCNKNSLVTPFKESARVVPDGQPIVHQFSHHQFFVGIENRGNKTIRNARLVITKLTMPDTPAKIPLLSVSTNSVSVDVQPDDMELFRFGTGFDHDTDQSSLLIRQHCEVEVMAKRLGTSPNRFSLGRGSISLLANDGYVVTLTAYADDNKAVSAKFRVNAKDRLEVFLES